jgi:hypothetical protein
MPALSRITNEEPSMNKMHNFTPIRLPGTVDNPDYRQAIEAVRLWAGPNVSLGDVGLFTPERGGDLPLSQRLNDRALDLGLCAYELAGSTMTYTATIPKGVASTGSLEVSMCVDEAGEAWVTSISVVSPVCEITPDDERELPEHIQIARSKWRFQLSRNAHGLAVAMMLHERGVAQDMDIDRLIELIEVGITRARAQPLRVSRV